MKLGKLAASAAVLALVPANNAGAATATCTDEAKPRAAAQALYAGEVVRKQRIAGLRTALVLEPRIAPGTRRRMVRTNSGWCDAAAGFNRAWTRAHDGAATAAAYARLAAAPYFDGVTVRDVSRTVRGVYTVRTHARTNGVEARWVIATDARGVRHAKWVATAFAVKPLVAEFEGLTALPGASETYSLHGSGLLVEGRGLPTAEAARTAGAPETSIPAVYTGPDGMEIRLSVGDTHVAVEPGIRTGIDRLDVQQNFMDAIRINYQEFHDWGLRKGWESDLDPVLGRQVGWVYINDALSLYCLACVFIADDFQIHMLSEVTTALAALGFNGYDDDRKALINVVGHEMFHNFQNAYNNPGPLLRSRGRSVSTAYSEGTARFQETLHSYGEVSHNPRTLVTGGQANPPGLSLDANHCNGFQGRNVDDAFTTGPFPKTYNACLFWTSWYSQNGSEAFLRLVTEAYPAHATKAPLQEGIAAIAQAAPGASVADQLEFFARSSLTNSNRSIAELSGDRQTHDWSEFFFKWEPPALAPGESVSKAINPGGVLGRRLVRDSAVALAGDALVLYAIRQSPRKTTTTRLPATATVDVPQGSGHKVWVVAVNPSSAVVPATLAVG